MTKDIIIFLGPQGSGKSTQAEIVSNLNKYTHIVESDLLRDFVNKKNKESKMVKEQMLKGKMIPFEISSDVLFKKIDKINRNKIIVDGFPRTIDQAHAFDYYLYSTKNNLKGIVYIDLPKKECIKRMLLRKRDDDTLKAINNRLKTYFEKTAAVIKYYKDKGKVIKINGNQPIEKVTKEILNKVKKIV